MTFGEACRKLKAAGFSELTDLSPRTKRKPPLELTALNITANEWRLLDAGEWEIHGADVVFKRHDGHKFLVYRAR